jgi:hypothetical protein
VNDEGQENLELRRMLDEAMPVECTEAGAMPQASLDPETAALRKTWQRFGELLAAGRPSERPIEIETAAVKLSPIAEPVEMRRDADRSDHRRRTPRRFRWSAVALAASLLVAVGLAVTLKIVESLKDRAVVPHANPSAVSREEKTALPSQVAQKANDAVTQPTNQKTTVVASNAATDDWSDSVDNDITAVARATALVKQDWYAQSGGLGAVETGVSDLTRELDQGPL